MLTWFTDAYIYMRGTSGWCVNTVDLGNWGGWVGGWSYFVDICWIYTTHWKLLATLADPMPKWKKTLNLALPKVYICTAEPPYTTVHYDMIWHDVMWCDVTWRGVTWHGMAWYGMVWYGMAWHDMTWHDMIWYITTGSMECPYEYWGGGGGGGGKGGGEMTVS